MADLMSNDQNQCNFISLLEVAKNRLNDAHHTPDIANNVLVNNDCDNALLPDNTKPLSDMMFTPDYDTPASTKLKGGYTSFTLSVRLWTEKCPLCVFNNTRWIHYIFVHLIKQLLKVCHM